MTLLKKDDLISDLFNQIAIIRKDEEGFVF
jgi:hypothetical protein